VETAEAYRDFAEGALAAGSPTYARLSAQVADDPRVTGLLDTLPVRPHPTLLFGALRWHDAPLSADWIVQHWALVADVLLTKRTQTNEPARCALLLPALAALPGPLALVEVGASAGLCLLYERWRYDYDGTIVGAGPVTLRCSVNDRVPVPARVPEITWRAGLDLNPLDASDPETRRWLECLVWPEHEDRRATLHAALDVAAADPPRVVRGDLLADLPRLLDEVPAGATVVVLHTAVLLYADRATRAAFVTLLRDRGVHRLGVESQDVLPHLAVPQVPPSAFVLSLDDDVLAVAQPHGRSLEWL
jgi:hypothetical protein